MRLVRVAVNAEQLLYRSPGGVGRYTAQLLTALPGPAGDLDVVAFTARHRPEAVQEALRRAGMGSAAAGAAIQALPRPVLYEAWHRLGRPRLALPGPIDLVHAPSVAVPPAAGRPLVVTVHDAASELFPEAFPRRGRRFHRCGLEAAARRADVVIAVSRAAADEIEAHSAIPAGRIRVVHNGIAPLGVPAAERADRLERLGLGTAPYVLWVGSLEPRKGVGTLVAAMAALRRGRAAEVTVVLAGYDGWLGDDLVDPADRAVLGPALVQTGRVGERDLWSLYAGAALFAFPSRHEGFGYPVLEAMSQGVPVVASDLPVLREVAGGAAEFVPVGRVDEWAGAIEALLGDPAARARAATAGVERARMFTVARCMASTRAVYEQILS